MSKFVLTSPKKTAILQKTKWCCAYCGIKLNQDIYTIDHILPRSKGGKNSIENLIAACRNCNARKGDKSIEQFRLWITHYETAVKHGLTIRQLEWVVNALNFIDKYPAIPHIFFYEKLVMNADGE